MNDDQFFGHLAANTDAARGTSERAPARLKSRLYSALIAEQAASGPLLSLPATRAAGRPLCVFEHVLQVVPRGELVTSMNPCRVCHARVLAEHFESPPIYWPHCPYVEFRRR
jgi:hypothetical protein